MESDLDKILKTIERISFSIIGLIAAISLLEVVLSLDTGIYRTLLEGLSVYFIVGAIILFIWVAYNVFTFSRPDSTRKK